MSHPARYSNDYTLGNVRIHTVHTSGGWDPGWQSLGNLDCLSWTLIREDETVVNDRRPDGTWPVSPFSADRVIVQKKPSKLSEANTFPYWGMYMKESSSAYTLFMDPLAGMAVFDTPPWRVPTLLRANADALARTEFLNKLGDISGKDKVQLGVMLGEVRETIGMAHELSTALISGIRSVAKTVNRSPQQVSKILDSVRKLGIRETANRLLKGDTQALERMVQAWLVVQFGIKPLAYDVYDASVYMQAELAKTDNYLTVAVRAGAEDVAEEEVHVSGIGFNGNTFDLYHTIRYSARYHYACQYDIPTTTTLAEDLGLYNPAVIAWELLRFSWLIDYVVGIGDWLRSSMAAQHTKFLEGTQSVVLETMLLSWRAVGVTGVEMQGLGSAPLVNLKQFKRTVLNHGVMPSLLPGVKVHLGLSQLANSLAALTTLVGARQSGGSWHLKQ